ncbi:hypothetical protein [Ilumatobacter sp.]|uniref:hypothetical protein n=1 Tax=Ilumatobacter sp. TaxID=1967498 RepID=UPI003B517D50
MADVAAATTRTRAPRTSEIPRRRRLELGVPVHVDPIDEPGSVERLVDAAPGSAGPPD